ncbi:MAG: hypothetical protein QOF73_2557 [Thermomicrobiales bacterium]|jgi:hypothetical protein|nr:hypothetical protein [Thermomicrobiales bacterium]
MTPAKGPGIGRNGCLVDTPTSQRPAIDRGLLFERRGSESASDFPHRCRSDADGGASPGHPTDSPQRGSPDDLFLLH